MFSRISYNVLKMATHVGRVLQLTLQTREGEMYLDLKLVSQEAACALYRSITECHAFYRCETVRSNVRTQFTRDLRETFSSFFSDDNSDKKYIFDVQRTCKEVYDHSRRELFKQGCDPISCVKAPEVTQQLCIVDEVNQSDTVTVLQEKLSTMEEALKCRICTDARIDVVFCPCGHMVSCSSCASNLDQCPICRGTITNVQHVFLPIAAD